jgi:hypothetical protein
MGRPLNKKYFGNRNIGSASVTTDDGIGGEGVASIAVSGTFSGRTTATPYAVTISAPDLPGGVQATATITFSTGSAGAVTITEGGSGYTGIPTTTCSLGGGTGTVTLTATLSVDTGNVGSVTNQENAIIMIGFLTGGSNVAVDIIKQVSTRRYKVTDGTRTGIVTLTGVIGGALTAGQGNIVATDASAGTYFVTKLTKNRATLTRGTGTVYVEGASVPWTFDTATATVCKIVNG